MLKKLSQVVPYQDLVGSFSNLENNSQYTNYTADLKDCYLLFDANRTDTAAYCTKSRQSSTVFDCLNIQHCEQCYECIDSTSMFACQYCYDSSGCTDCAYMIDCHGCDHCI